MFLQPGSPPLFENESNNYWKIVWDILDEAQEYATEHRDRIPEDMSLRDWLDQYVGAHQSEDPEGEKYMSKLMKMAVHGLAMYWADENAIPMEKVSMKYMDAEDVFPGEHSLVTNGYDRMVKALTSQLKDARVLLEHVVDKIEYSESEVKVSTNHGTFTADEVLVTLPLGVLKSQSSSLFSPVLPISKQHAINNLGFGTMFKIFLFFPTCFWPEDKHFINFLPSSFTKQPNAKLVSRFNLNSRQVEALTVYMQDLANYSSFMPVYNKPILVGYATNQAAELMERLSDEEARMVYICQLSHYYDILLSNKPDQGESLWPKVSFMSRWNQDPFARGSYTSIPVGASTSDIEEFQIPVTARAYGTLVGDDDYEHCDIESNLVDPSVAVLTSVNDTEGGRVFFAGEHTSSGHFASVQGALMSGRLAAAKILGQYLI
ncbi:putative lysine-specific histone demethylase 1 [Mortierella sp. AM989]|nr:putative lysine-specific histone demethylase 1 [Mortierella sp. AM989]